MQTYWNELLPSLESLGVWGYWLVGLLVFGEALVLTSVLAPGTVVVVLGGALVARGIYDFGDMIWFVAIGTILGSQASFAIGSKGAQMFQEGRRVFNPAHIDRGKRFFAKYGATSIVLGHFFGPLRPIIPVVAGLSDMQPRRFLVWNVIGGLAYAIIMLGVGYFFGTAMDVFSATATRAGLFVIGVLLALALLWFIAAKLRKMVPLGLSVSRSVWRAIQDNPDVRSIVGRHPGLFRFLSARLSRKSFSGLPVTVLAAAFGYFLLLYVAQMIDYATQSKIVALDVRVSNLLFSFRDPDLVRFFSFVTAFGAWNVVTIIGICAAALMWLLHRPHYMPGMVISMISNLVTVNVVKVIFARPRSEMAVYVESTYSFPSGHSATSAAFFGFLTYVLVREKIGPVLVTVLMGVTVIFLIGLSRIYLVEHYLSDVLNGYLVGALCLIPGIWVTEWLHARNGDAGQGPILSWRKAASVGVGVGGLVALWFVVSEYQQKLNLRPVPVIAEISGSVETAFADGHLPTHSESILGVAQEPISVIILAPDDATLVQAFRRAGWHRADRPGLGTMSRAAFAMWFDTAYDTAPITPAFWDGQPHDFGFEAETTDKTLRSRHHARFWRAGVKTADGQAIYVGTASLDQGMKWGLIHHIDPNIDAERNFLVADLEKSDLVRTTRQIQLVAPVLGENLTGDPFFTDGMAVVLQLEPTPAAKTAPPETVVPKQEVPD